MDILIRDLCVRACVCVCCMIVISGSTQPFFQDYFLQDPEKQILAGGGCIFTTFPLSYFFFYRLAHFLSVDLVSVRHEKESLKIIFFNRYRLSFSQIKIIFQGFYRKYFSYKAARFFKLAAHIIQNSLFLQSLQIQYF